MKHRIITTLGLALSFFTFSHAQQGDFVYSLPMTNLRVKAEAVCEQFVAGPYAKYAKKYLGIEAVQNDYTTYHLSGVEVKPLLEADPQHIYTGQSALLKSMGTDIFKITSQGLVILADNESTGAQRWRFSVPMKDVSDAGVVDNIADEVATLYKSVSGSTGVKNIPVQQSQMVEKSLEKKAQEAAQQIFLMRGKRMDIITGNTDATYSGEAMKSAIEEMRRVEDEYLTLFLGEKRFEKQTVSFDVIPSKDEDSQVYVAFRLSDESGLLPADNMEGRPIVLSLSGEQVQGIALQAKQGVSLYYRIPSIMNVKLMDGQKILLQTRVPVYQLGQITQLPVIVKK